MLGLVFHCEGHSRKYLRQILSSSQQRSVRTTAANPTRAYDLPRPQSDPEGGCGLCADACSFDGMASSLPFAVVLDLSGPETDCWCTCPRGDHSGRRLDGAARRICRM